MRAVIVASKLINIALYKELYIAILLILGNIYAQVDRDRAYIIAFILSYKLGFKSN